MGQAIECLEYDAKPSAAYQSFAGQGLRRLDKARVYGSVPGRVSRGVPERKLVFTWERAAEADPHVAPEQRSLVTVDLRTIPGGAELVFTHAQFDDETTRDDHRRGWNSAFDKLEALFAQPAERMSHGTA
jgi:uncharacterized protein YndB with AHSA1/START domain